MVALTPAPTPISLTPITTPTTTPTPASTPTPAPTPANSTATVSGVASTSAAAIHPIMIPPMLRRVASLDTMRRVQAVAELDYVSRGYGSYGATTGGMAGGGGAGGGGGGGGSGGGGAGGGDGDPVSSFFQLLNNKFNTSDRSDEQEKSSTRVLDSEAIATAVNEGVQRGITQALGYLGRNDTVLAFKDVKESDGKPQHSSPSLARSRITRTRPTPPIETNPSSQRPPIETNPSSQRPISALSTFAPHTHFHTHPHTTPATHTPSGITEAMLEHDVLESREAAMNLLDSTQSSLSLDEYAHALLGDTGTSRDYYNQNVSMDSSVSLDSLVSRYSSCSGSYAGYKKAKGQRQEQREDIDRPVDKGPSSVTSPTFSSVDSADVSFVRVEQLLGFAPLVSTVLQQSATKEMMRGMEKKPQPSTVSALLKHTPNVRSKTTEGNTYHDQAHVVRDEGEGSGGGKGGVLHPIGHPVGRYSDLGVERENKMISSTLYRAEQGTIRGAYDEESSLNTSSMQSMDQQSISSEGPSRSDGNDSLSSDGSDISIGSDVHLFSGHRTEEFIARARRGRGGGEGGGGEGEDADLLMLKHLKTIKSKHHASNSSKNNASGSSNSSRVKRRSRTQLVNDSSNSSGTPLYPPIHPYTPLYTPYTPLYHPVPLYTPHTPPYTPFYRQRHWCFVG